MQCFIKFLTCGAICVSLVGETMKEWNVLSAVVKGADDMSCRREWAENNEAYIGKTGYEEV